MPPGRKRARDAEGGSSASSHHWDVPAVMHWDNAAGDGESEREEHDITKMSQTECAEAFAQLLEKLKVKGKLYATEASQLAYWAARGGCTGRASDLGLAPGKQTGKYSDHSDKATVGDPSNDKFYFEDVPS